MSAHHHAPDVSGVRDPPGSVTVTDDGRRVRAVWHPFCRVTRTALFRVVTDDRVAVLDHVREVRVRQLGETTNDLDAEATLGDIPRARLARMRDLGFVPAEEVAP